MLDPDARLDAIEDDLGVRLARWALWAAGAAWALAAMVGGPWAGVSVVASPIGQPQINDILGAVVAITLIVVGFGSGLLHFVVAWGLGEGKRWAWLTAIVLGGIAVLQCCLPVGIVVLGGMLNDRTRALFAPGATPPVG